MSQFLKSADSCFAVINRVEFVQVQQFNARMGCESRCQQANEELGFRSREKTVSVAWPEEGIGNQPHRRIRRIRYGATRPLSAHRIWAICPRPIVRVREDPINVETL
jgi:hypothetical protein